MGMAKKAHLEALQMADSQRKRASRELLQSKRRVERDVPFVLIGNDGPEEVDLLFRSIGFDEYDSLVTKFPPTDKQRKEGLTYDLERFAPILLTKVCADPTLTEEEWKEIWRSGDWNRGELMTLFSHAVDVCSNLASLDPTESA